VKAWHFLVVVLVGCDEPPDVVAPIETCSTDADCSGGVCARTGECVLDAQARKAQVLWTIRGQSPTDENCYWIPNVKVEFRTQPEVGQGETWESDELSCLLGKFSVDKLPARFFIGGAKSPSAGMWVPLDDAGVAKVDLP
jgi:hypothetical protein